MKTEALPIVECSGSSRQRGRAHGEALRGVIAEKIRRWHAAIEEAYPEKADDFLRRFLVRTRFRSAIVAHAPELLDEVTGIAEGAAIDAECAFALQLMDEEWWFGKRVHHAHCSSVGVAAPRAAHTLMGQTMDLPAWHDGAQAVLRMTREGETESLVFTSAGMIGLMGLSPRGIGVCVNTLAALPTSDAGLPVAFVMRSALGCGTVDEAARMLAGVPHASGQNYQLGDREGVRDFECSADGIVEVQAQAGAILHTNHPLAGVAAPTNDPVDAPCTLSRARLHSLAQDLGGLGRVTADDIRLALGAGREAGRVSIETQGGPLSTMTVGAVIYEMGDVPTFRVSGGPPSVTTWRTVE